MAYESTKVPVVNSQRDIQNLLARHEASGYRFGQYTREGVTKATVEFVTEDLTIVKMEVALKDKTDKEERRIWRVILHNLKARLVSVEEGVETFTEAFLPHIVNQRTGRTVYEELSDSGRIELENPLPLRPALPPAKG